jgi:hypothetical protein
VQKCVDTGTCCELEGVADVFGLCAWYDICGFDVEGELVGLTNASFCSGDSVWLVCG